MEKIYAVDVCWQMSEEKLWLVIEDRTKFILVFDDGTEIETTWGQTATSWYFWEFHRRYNHLPILVDHHINNERVTQRLPIRILENIRDLMEEYHPEVDREEVEALAYRITNNIHNAFASNPTAEKYQMSLDAIDLLGVMYYQPIIDAINQLTSSKRSVSDVYAKVDKILNTDPGIKHNRVSIAVRNKQVKIGQLMQILVCRGYCAEINQRIFKNMIPVGFGHGLRRLSFFLMCTRDASKASASTEDPVKQTEYYNREIQLVTYAVNKVAKDDCGSTKTMPWKVTANHFKAGTLQGIYYYDEADGQLKVFSGTEKHLVGKTIDIRTPWYCNHPKDGTLCRYCLGEISDRIQRGINPGFALAVTKNEGITQETISIKHHLQSAVSGRFDLDEYYTRYLTMDEDGLEFYLSREVALSKVSIILNNREVSGMSNFTDIDSYSDGYLSRLSAISSVEIKTIVNNNKDTVTIPLNRGSYKPYLTRAFIEYIRDYGYSFTETGESIEIDMGQWDSENPLFELPERHDSVLEHMILVKAAIFGTDKNMKPKFRYDLRDPERLSEMVTDIFELVNEKFDINLSIIQLVLYCMSIRNSETGDYRPPKLFTNARLAGQQDIMSNRSLSAKAAYQLQFNMVTDPNSYIRFIRSNHPFDRLLMNIDERKDDPEVLAALTQLRHQMIENGEVATYFDEDDTCCDFIEDEENDGDEELDEEENVPSDAELEDSEDDSDDEGDEDDD